jgi:hypothetical protein
MSNIGQWLDANDPSVQHSTDKWGLSRLRRQHGLQISMDVIAQVQNYPLRLLRKENLSALSGIFVRMVNRWKCAVQTLLRESGSSEARESATRNIDTLLDPSHLTTLRSWVLSLGTNSPIDRPATIPHHYERWILELLPHLEREVWLTDMSNPHPADTMSRMVEHWSLFILMWAWENVSLFETTSQELNRPRIIRQFLGMSHMAITTEKAFVRVGRDATSQEVWILGGPFELEHGEFDPVNSDVYSHEPSSHWFNKTFSLFVRNAATVQAWNDAADTAPNAAELLDAFAARPPLSADEALRRASASRKAISEFRSAKLHNSVQKWPDGASDRPISSANWETIAALITWLIIWSSRLEQHYPRQLLVSIPGHRLSLHVFWEQNLIPNSNDSIRRVTILDPRFDDAKILIDGAYEVSKFAREVMKQSPDQGIEVPSAFLARVRQRQYTSWTTDIGAIANLLGRNGSRDRLVGQDSFWDASSHDPACDEVDHLLRGQAGRICNKLLQMFRADNAAILWMDYSINPPQLRHVGDADKLIQHRAERQARYKIFRDWSRIPNSTYVGAQAPCSAGIASPTLLYRAIAAADIEPQALVRWTDQPDARVVLDEHCAHYSAPNPLDSMAVPLLFNGRIVGVFAIRGISTVRQFNRRLHAPLRLVAQQLAQAIATQSQLWQMRRLNWLASHVPLEYWKQIDEENQFNPLQHVSESLANVFLAPVVYIWLRDRQNSDRFKLHGYTHGEILKVGNTNLTKPFYFTFERASEGYDVPLDREFAAFGLELASNQNVKELAGSFVQARFVTKAKIGTSRGVTEYRFSAAQQGTMSLYEDFVNANDSSSFRQRLFLKFKHHQCMAFPLVDTSDPEAKPIGVVTVHSPSPTREDQPIPWPANWRPIVAHIQTYLPYIFMQTEAIANPIYNMRRYILHEARNELNAASGRFVALNEMLHQLLEIDRPAGRIRPWLRNSIPKLESLVRSPANQTATLEWMREGMTELSILDSLLKRIPQIANQLLSGRLAENLGLLARFIDYHPDLTFLGDPNTSQNFNHETEWVQLHSKIVGQFGAYREIWKELGIAPDIDPDIEGVEVLTNEPLWNLMTVELVHNLARYAYKNEPIMVKWNSPSGGTNANLRISTVSSYNSLQDREDRIVQFGTNGPAGTRPPRNLSGKSGIMVEGQGIGLWGALAVSKLLNVQLTTKITPRTDSSVTYAFILAIPKRILRLNRG